MNNCNACQAYRDEHVAMYCPEHENEPQCMDCGKKLEPIWENNGHQAPDPDHWEITGYKPCDHAGQEDTIL